jgi:hypothetical protein
MLVEPWFAAMLTFVCQDGIEYTALTPPPLPQYPSPPANQSPEVLSTFVPEFQTVSDK